MGELTALPHTSGKAPPPLVSSTLIVSRTPPSPDQPTGLRRLDASATSLVVKLATSACVDPTPFCEGTVCKTCYFQLHRLIKLEHQYSKLRDEFVARMVATVPAISEHQLQHPSRRPQRNQVCRVHRVFHGKFLRITVGRWSIRERGLDSVGSLSTNNSTTVRQPLSVVKWFT